MSQWWGQGPVPALEKVGSKIYVMNNDYIIVSKMTSQCQE